MKPKRQGQSHQLKNSSTAILLTYCTWFWVLIISFALGIFSGIYAFTAIALLLGVVFWPITTVSFLFNVFYFVSLVHPGKKKYLWRSYSSWI